MKDKKKMGLHRLLGAKGVIRTERKEYGLMKKERQWGENRKLTTQVSKRKQRNKAQLPLDSSPLLSYPLSSSPRVYLIKFK